jgi:uncharacterized protein
MVQDTMGIAMRLLRSGQEWWCVLPSGAVRLPDDLVEAGALTPDGRAAVAATRAARVRPVGHYSLTVATTTACNLGCSYCFQNTQASRPGRFDPPRIPTAKLRPSTMDAIGDFTRDRMAERGVDRLHVVLFGGEPLLDAEGCLAVLRRCARFATVTATLVTNGVLLRPTLARRLRAGGLRTVQVTLDGPRAVHDTVRVSRAGRPTFRTIVGRVAAVLEETDLDVLIRVNVGEAALPRLDELINALAVRLDATRCGLVFAPVRDYRPDAAGSTTSCGTPEATQRILTAYANGRAAGFRLPRPRLADCDFCTAPGGRRGAVVNADGGLYSCWETVGQPGQRVGHVQTGYASAGHDGPAWRRCRELAEPGAAGAFRDAVDAGLLDLLAAGKSETTHEGGTHA